MHLFFSLDNKEIYHSYNSCFIYDNINYRHTFENGHDLHISSGYMNKNDSYEYTPYSYDTKGKKYALN